MYNLKIKTNLFLLFLLFFSFEIYGQDENSSAPKIIPPSPTAYELGRYGQTDVGTFTGTPNISVPLYTYKTRNLSIPITLGYNSNGIQVDQMETNVGLGWNLNVGGVINRIVRGKPDEERYYPINEDDCLSNSFISYMEANKFNDTEPDLYSYSFNGHSGQFVFDKNNKAVLVPHNNLKIERLKIDLKDYFKVTTDDGVEYYFSDNEYSSWQNTEAATSVLTGWYLSKIIHPAGDTINFTYRDSNYSFTSSISFSFPVKTFEEVCSDRGVNPGEEKNVNILHVLGKTIESISSNEAIFGKVVFQHIYNPNLLGTYLIKGYQVDSSKESNLDSVVFDYLFTPNKRIFLKECTFKDVSKKYSFEYNDPNGLNSRLSGGKDLWGFYNGKSGVYPDPVIHEDLYSSNQKAMDAIKRSSRGGDRRADPTLASKGILKKIMYPTKGYNEFVYEGNSVMGTVVSPIELETINRRLSNPSTNSNLETEIYEFKNVIKYKTDIEALVSYVGMAGDMPVGELFLKITIENLQNALLNDEVVAFRHNFTEKDTYTFLENTDYRVTVTFSSEPKTSANFNFSYATGGNVSSIAPINVGGLRIQQITSFDNEQNKADIKHYYYGPRKNRDITSGVEGVEMNFISNSIINRVCWVNSGPSPITSIARTYLSTVHPNSLYQLYRSNGNNSTTYRNVTVSYGGADYENGGEELFYYASSDARPTSCVNNHLNSAPWTNTSWDNGLLEKKIIFDKNLTDLNITDYKYKLEDQFTQSVTGIAYDTKFNQIFSFPSPDRKNLEHMNINRYSTNSYWFYLESEINIQNDSGGKNPITTFTKYKYNNPSHLKLSSQTVTNSLNEELETRYFYPQDLEMANEPFRNELIARNMFGKVLDTQTLKKGVKLSEQKTVYERNAATANLLLPKFIYANKGLDNIDLNSDKKIVYDKYDEKGNILQYTIESGTPVAIIWGYNKSQPIAKIENATYAELEALPGFGAGFTILESLSSDQESILRNNLSEAMVTTYTYNPLVGITSVTDPKGIPTYYGYDSFGRLQYVKDQNLYVLQRYCYNYKGQQADCGTLDNTVPVSYKSKALSKLFTRNNCASGGIPESVWFTIQEGAYSSNISQAAADQQALDQFDVKGREFANNDENAKCIFKSAAIASQNFQKTNCTIGGTGSYVAYSLDYEAVKSKISQADADNLAWKKFQSEGSANANANGECIFRSAAISGSFQKSGCTGGAIGSYENYSLAEGAVTLNTSQADVDAKAINRLNTEGPANANDKGQCVFYSVYAERVIRRLYCPKGQNGTTVLYTVPSGKYNSIISQADADRQAEDEIKNEGQNYADRKGECSKGDIPID
ncbi:DUF5977 domain-containing protein [Flavobacterium tructae]|uniref:DUF5977 domain-containing protein n=1 Tax=Flavobacterium tructae TaxID=1114873 RepID=UPI002551EDB7|nr:DUF5977 domain-containing protein [Flavobacterium tructae]MDL2142608.1 DUF5977 domain-containing protein [Flavobacterium tructae]